MRALRAAAATAAPPFSLMLVTAGSPLSRSACFASTAPTKPTGSPMTSAGAGPRARRSASAVGAVPITQTAPGPTSRPATRMPAAARVMPSTRVSAAEAGEMGAAVTLRNVIGEAQHVLVVAVVPPQRGLHPDAVALRAHHDRGRHDRLLVAIEIFDELLDAAIVVHLLALLDRMAHVREYDVDAGIEEGELAQAMLQRREIIFDVLEGLAGRKERHLCAALARRVADLFQRRDRVAMGELDVVLLVVAPDAKLKLAGERIDHGDADAVQAARYLVGVLVEFAAGMELGHDDLGRRDAFALVDVDGNAAAVVAHGHRSVGVEDDLDPRGETGQRLVDRIVDDLVDH